MSVKGCLVACWWEGCKWAMARVTNNAVDREGQLLYLAVCLCRAAIACAQQMLPTQNCWLAMINYIISKYHITKIGHCAYSTLNVNCCNGSQQGSHQTAKQGGPQKVSIFRDLESLWKQNRALKVLEFDVNCPWKSLNCIIIIPVIIFIIVITTMWKIFEALVDWTVYNSLSKDSTEAAPAV